MATKNIKIPQEFIDAMKKFMDMMKKLGDTTIRISTQAARFTTTHVASLSSRIHGLFRRLPPLFNRFLNVLRSSINNLVRFLGPTARSFINMLTIPSNIFSGIRSLTSFMGLFRLGASIPGIGWIFAAGWSVYRVGRWVYEKTVHLMEALQKDRMRAMTSFTTVGGLRAYQALFFWLPQDPRLFSALRRAPIDPMSRETMLLYGILGVPPRGLDTVQGMTTALTNAQRYLTQFPGQEAVVAEWLQLPLTEETIRVLTELQQKDPKKIEEQAKKLIPLRRQLEPGRVTQRRIERLLKERIILLARIRTGFLRFIVDSGIADFLIKLARLLRKFFEVKDDDKPPGPEKKPESDALADWMYNIGRADIRDLTNKVDQFNEKMAEWRRSFNETLGNISSAIAQMLLPGAAAQVYRPGIRIPGYPGTTVFRPGIRIRGRPAPPSMPARPGTTVFRRGIRIPGRPAPEPRTGVPYKEPPLGAPRAPAEAAETVEEAVKKGYRRAEGTGLYDRSNFKRELDSNPALRQRVAAIAMAEGGTSSEAQTAVVEAMMNRARVRGHTLAQEAEWSDRGGYYAAEGRGRGMGMTNNPNLLAGANSSIDRALNGSRIVGQATDQASNQPGNNLADRDIASGKFTLVRKMPNGEYYFTRNSEDAKRAALNKQEKPPGAPQTMAPLRLEDLNAAQQNANSKGNVITSTGDPRLTTVGNYRLGGDPRRQALIDAATEASRNLPAGWRVEAYSGQRDGSGQGPHAYSGAVDFRLIDPQGHMVENYQHPENFAVYEKFAQDTHAILQRTNPALAAQHRWGGYFSGPIGPSGTYGAMDLMHQDFAGGDSRMAAGQWATGLYPGWRDRWGVGEHSPGISAREQERSRIYVPPAWKPPPWPEHGAPPIGDEQDLSEDKKPEQDKEKDHSLTHPGHEDITIKNNSDVKVNMDWDNQATYA